MALGKPFVLSSNYPGTPISGIVGVARPYFFHTRIEPRPYITIDLQSVQRVNRIVLSNRTNGERHRADTLFATIHDQPDDRFADAFPLNVDETFLQRPPLDCITETGGQAGRYVTVFSPRRTALHLSAIRVLAD